MVETQNHAMHFILSLILNANTLAAIDNVDKNALNATDVATLPVLIIKNSWNGLSSKLAICSDKRTVTYISYDDTRAMNKRRNP